MTLISMYKHLFAFLLLFCCSCAQVTAVSSVVVGSTMMDERSTGDVVDDAVIMMKIKDLYMQTEVNELFHRVNVYVSEGRVMLVGNVKDSYYKRKAEELVWKIRGVRELITELIIREESVSQGAKDLFIQNTIKSKMLFHKDIKSINYHVDVNNNVAYMLGIAQDEPELQRAQKIAASVKGVRQVVSHVILKADLRRDYNTYKNDD